MLAPNGLTCAATLWFAMLKGGINADIAGVIAAVAIPASAPAPAGSHVSGARASRGGGGGAGAPHTHPSKPASFPLERNQKEKTLHLRRLFLSPLHSTTNARAQAHAMEPGMQQVTLLDHLIHKFHPYSSLFIMPLFALANCAVPVNAAVGACCNGGSLL
jgi:Na+/H+ antiporter NhaA